ncbi:hypothetical protein [Novosphingobium sp. Leaf2]|uniref:hypothetical protein n=1 Tax=Novosphingobium sp. Leaf2 TaxID=1735670 RepID=UPI00138F4B45|nr:hypothetical protein [Novosphingobium sp. Leaf2]
MAAPTDSAETASTSDTAPPVAAVRRAAGRTPIEAARRSPVKPAVPATRDQAAANDSALASGAVPRAAVSPAPVAKPAARATTPVVPATQQSNVPVAGIAGILAALGVAGLGIFALRRRRRNEPEYDEADYAPASLAETALEAEPAQMAVAREVARPAMPTLSGNTASRVLATAGMPHSPEERQALLESMVAAEPDEGNPFTSRKARMRRARIQLQHAEHQEVTMQNTPFDYRTYQPSIPRTDQVRHSEKPPLIDA